jgi:superfamily II DNA or RNA helicase
MTPIQTQKLLAGCKSWRDIRTKISRLPKKKKQAAFTNLVRFRLLILAEFCSQLVKIWHQPEAPIRIRKKIRGVKPESLLAETHNGKVWVIDCHYTHKKELSQAEISKLTSKPQGADFHLLCVNADHSEEEMPKHFGFLGLETWENTSREEIQIMRGITPNKTWRPPASKRQPLQIEATRKTVAYFKNPKRSRGKITLPCGSGKSLIGYWAHLDLKSQRTLITLPSLALLKQTLQVWLKENMAHRKAARWACVCGDNSVSKIDRTGMAAQDLGIPCLTDLETIQTWLGESAGSKKPIIVFSTYQSAKVLATACRNAHFKFELAIHDEAHKTAGREGKHFAHTIHNKNLRARRRIFMTATERQYNGELEEVLSMDDPKTYGGTIHSIPFKEAVSRNIICDQRILSIAVTKSEIRELIEANAILLPDNDEWEQEVKARHFAALIAFHKACKKYPIHHTVSFHNSIRDANRFQEQNQTYCKIMGRQISCLHISGQTPAGARAHTLREFERKKNALITNARCLIEGVDIPNIDAVIFVEGRKSTVDVVQSAGRAMRKAPNKTYGYIILPVIIDDESPEKKHGFESVLWTLRSLAVSDDRIIEYFHNLNEKLLGEEDFPPWDENDIHIPIGFESFKDAITIREFRIGHWLPFEETRAYARSLKLQSLSQWENLAKARKLPYNVPAAPRIVYPDQWAGWLDFLGKPSRDWIPFKKARKIARELNIPNGEAWKTLARKGKLPAGLPTVPATVYAKKGWVDWADFLGGKCRMKNWIPFEEARKYARGLKLKRVAEWTALAKNKKLPQNIPATPVTVYQTEWTNWCDFLGNRPRRDFLPFQKARKVARSLKIKNRAEWMRRSKAGKIPENLPINPKRVYKEWKGWHDFLGNPKPKPAPKKTPKPPPKKRPEFVSFKRARKIAETKGIESKSQWIKLVRSKELNENLPIAPDAAYKGKGWVSWYEFLNKPKPDWLPFKEARKYARKLKLKSGEEWKRRANEKKLPENLPTYPQRIYKNKGWGGWSDFLGLPEKTRNWLTFSQARKYARSLKLKSGDEWKRLAKARKLPQNVPLGPQNHYKEEWTNWYDFLGRPGNEWVPFEEARKIGRSLRITNKEDWQRFLKNELPGKKRGNVPLPTSPRTAYPNKWKGWGDFLGNETIRYNTPYKVARAFARGLRLKNVGQWKQYTTGKMKNKPKRPAHIPKDPPSVFKNKGWKGWRDFLGI